MKTVVLENAYRLILGDVDPPILRSEEELMIKVRIAALCGSEIHAFKGTHPFRKPPVVLGHEVAGQVVQAGSRVRGLAQGDRVFVDPQWPCESCEWCVSGEHQLCGQKRILGTAQWPGALGECITAPASSVYPLRSHVSYVQGALAEPLSVAVHATRRARLAGGHSVVVLGTGPIGMMVSAVSSVLRASPIIAVDRHTHCLKIASRRFGATHTVLGGEDSIWEQVSGITGPRGVDAVFLTAGVPHLFQDALQIVRKKGTIVLLALFDELIPMEAFGLIGKDLDLMGSSMYNADDIRTALELIGSGSIRPEGMVSHRLPLDQVQHGFEIAETKEDQAVKVVIDMDL